MGNYLEKTPKDVNPDFKNWKKLRDIFVKAADLSKSAAKKEEKNDVKVLKELIEEAREFLRINFFELSPIPEYGDLMPKEEWIANCEAGGFIDYDGYGYLATEHSMSNIVIVPSDLLDQEISDWWTHVVWFNR